MAPPSARRLLFATLLLLSGASAFSALPHPSSVRAHSRHGKQHGKRKAALGAAAGAVPAGDACTATSRRVARLAALRGGAAANPAAAFAAWYMNKLTTAPIPTKVWCAAGSYKMGGGR